MDLLRFRYTRMRRGLRGFTRIEWTIIRAIRVNVIIFCPSGASGKIDVITAGATDDCLPASAVKISFPSAFGSQRWIFPHFALRHSGIIPIVLSHVSTN